MVKKGIIGMFVFVLLFLSPLTMFMAATSKQTNACTPTGQLLFTGGFPVKGKARISQHWGNGNAMYSSGIHDGIDITGEKPGDKVPVFSISDGEVVIYDNEGSDSGGYGTEKTFKVKSTINNKVYYFIYYHMDSLEESIKQGDQVKKGQQFGFMGTTGNSTGVHLHVQIATESENTVDPYSFLFGASAEKMKQFPTETPFDTGEFGGGEVTSSTIAPTSTSCTSSGTIATTLEGNSNAEKTWNYLKSHGFTNEGVAGIVGNLMAESQLDPLAGEAGGNGGGRGIMQWGQCGTASNGANAGCRWKSLENWARSQNKNPDELQTQLEWMIEELKERNLYDTYKTITVIYTQGGTYGGGSVGIFTEKMEAPDPKYAHMDKRESYAMDAIAKFGG